MMDYNNYYPVQAGPPPLAPPPTHMMNNQPDYSMMSGSMTPNSIMHSSPAPSTPQSMRHTPGPPPMQQHHPLGHHQQQPSPHPHYHQLPPHPPISHSASPHPSHTPQGQPPPRPATGPSPLHHQVPPHMSGQSPKIPPPGSMQPMHPSGMPNSNPHQHHIAPSGPQPPQPPPQGHAYPGNSLPPHGGHPYGQPPINHTNSLGPPPMNSHGPPQPMSNGPVMGGPPPAPPSGYMPAAQERSSPFYNRVLPTEFRIIELNKRLQNRPRPRGPSSPLPSYESSEENIWWERFANDFFDNDATLTVSIPGDVKPQEFTIGRPLISRFFRSYFDGGITDLSFKLRSIREAQHHPNLTRMDCDQTDIITKNIFKHPANMYMYAVVHSEGHLSLDFVNNSFDNLVIKSWRFLVNQCHEYIDRSMTSAGLHDAYLAQPVTRFGLTKSTYAYLKMCLVMEPMQGIMALSKSSPDLDPRASLKNIVLKIRNTEERPQPKRRKRKPAELGTTNKKSKAGANLMNSANVMGNSMGLMTENEPGMLVSLASQDVLVVGEPSMLGADFGDENERSITRLVNNQYESPTDPGSQQSVGTPNDSNQMNQGCMPSATINQGQQSDMTSHLAQGNGHDHSGNNGQSMLGYPTESEQQTDDGMNSQAGGISKHEMSEPNLAISGNNNNNNNNNNNGNCLQGNNDLTSAGDTHHHMNSYAMTGETNHIKSEMDLQTKQQSMQANPTAESEAR